MKRIHLKKLNILFAVLVIFTLALVMLFGVSFSMLMNKDGTMEKCLFSNNSDVICPMSVFRHLNLWNSIFAANLPKVVLASLNLIILFFGLVLAAIISKNQLNDFSKNSIHQKLYLKQKPNLSFFDYLKEAFSQGIIKPKIYKLATI